MKEFCRKIAQLGQGYTGLKVLLGSGEKVGKENSFRETNSSSRKLKRRIAMMNNVPAVTNKMTVSLFLAPTDI